MIVIHQITHNLHNPPFELYDGVEVPYAESPGRVASILEALSQNGEYQIIPPNQYQKHYITAVHDAAYVAFVESAAGRLNQNEVLYPSYFMTDTYAPITAGTYQAAIAAVDIALTGADLILASQKVVYGLCRPPGHHAGRHNLGGYCYFNNAAIAANYLSSSGKVAILDIDFHHGNGTQEIFYDRDDVLYVSLHAEPEHNYPYVCGHASESGKGSGLGKNWNFPLPKNTTIESYLRVLETAVGKLVNFEADFLIVSAGFDTLKTDPIAGFDLKPQDYTAVGQLIQKIGLPTLIIQEGGYDLANLGTAANNFLAVFNG